MAEIDILNPGRGYDPRFRDSMNPNYGWKRTRTPTLATIKSAFGRPWTRETGNTGYTYTLNFTRRNIIVTDRLRRFADEFESGFFTLIDWDAGTPSGRHYVGRFVGETPQTMDTNSRFSSAGWQFEEVPGAPMLQYPDQWDRWAVMQRPWDDFGDQSTATSGNWLRPSAVVRPDGTSFKPNQIVNLSPAAGDWITHEYRGYGFRLWANQGPAYSQAELYLDGVAVSALNLHADFDMGPQVVYENAKIPLGIHRVQVVLNAQQGMLWDHIEVMR